MMVYKPANPISRLKGEKGPSSGDQKDAFKIDLDLHATGGLDDLMVRKTFEGKANALRYCYEKEHTKTPHLRASIKLAFTLDEDGAGLAAQ